MQKIYLIIVLVIFSASACKKNITVKNEDIPPVTDKFTQKEILSQVVTVNTSGFAPLTARILLTTNIPTRVSLRVVGKNGGTSDVVKEFDSLSTNQNIAVLGLYGDYANTVELTLFDSNGKNLGSSAIKVQTASLSQDLPNINIQTSLSGKRPGMTLISYFGYAVKSAPLKPFVFDEFGDIRWYLDYSKSSVLNNLFYDDGVDRLKNGNLYFADDYSGAVYEVNMFGEILNSWPFPGYTFHHEVLEKPNGNFLLSVSKNGLSTVEDFVIEIGRDSKQIINTWDLRQSLQYSRTTLIGDRKDWIHVNALWYDESDNTIIVSGRTQGIAKIDQNNKVVWIMGPHRGWGLAGDGTDLTTKLLTPLDANDQLITDTAILNGGLNHKDFEWNWYQHAVKLNPNGDIMMFDNGDNRNFTGYGPYSRAVEYRIDPANRTVKQIWQYGKERGPETYSRIVSDVDYHPDVNHVIFSPGAVNNNGFYGKVIELDYNSLQLLFEATIHPPPQFIGPVTFHRSERLNLYP